MPKTKDITLGDGMMTIPILFEDRSVLAIDKPAGWMLAPNSWDRTGRNLQLALESAIGGGEHWARSRNLRFLRFVHRLDADTSGVLLLVKSPGAMRAYSELFETGQVEKTYLAVVSRVPPKESWVCDASIGMDPYRKGLMRPDRKAGKPAETHFEVLQRKPDTALVLARPRTGRTHQIRVHLQESGYPIVGDTLYGGQKDIRPPERWTRATRPALGLRAMTLEYTDPFTHKDVRIRAGWDHFVKDFGFDAAVVSQKLQVTK